MQDVIIHFVALHDGGDYEFKVFYVGDEQPAAIVYFHPGDGCTGAGCTTVLELQQGSNDMPHTVLDSMEFMLQHGNAINLAILNTLKD